MTGNLQYRFSATADLAGKRFVDGELANRYLHGPLVDQLLVDERVDASESLSRWVLSDHQGTVRDLAVRDASTDEIIISNHRVFDAFGNLLSETAGGETTIFGYAGREWEEVADLQFNRARWYDPTIGRWISQDPIGFAAGDANLYRYVLNRATTLTDPSGLQPPPGPDTNPYDNYHDGVFWTPNIPTPPPPGYRPPPIAPRCDSPAYDGPSISQAPPILTWQQRAMSRGHSVWEIILVQTFMPGGGFDQAISVVGSATPGSPIAVAGGAKPLYVPPKRNAWVNNPVETGYIRGYRAVSVNEYLNILQHRQLRPGPNSLEGKWIAGSYQGAIDHATGAGKAKPLFPNGRYFIIEVDVPINANELSKLPNLDGHGPALFVPNALLPQLSPKPTIPPACYR